MEAVVFHNKQKPEVHGKLKSFVVVQLHCDHKDRVKKDFALGLQGRLVEGDSTQPAYVVFDPRLPGPPGPQGVLRRWAYNLDHAFWTKQLDDGLQAYKSAKM